MTRCAVHWDYDAETWVTTSTHDDIVRSAEEKGWGRKLMRAYRRARGRSSLSA